MITETQLLDSGIVKYDHPGTVMKWRNGMD